MMESLYALFLLKTTTTTTFRNRMICCKPILLLGLLFMSYLCDNTNVTTMTLAFNFFIFIPHHHRRIGRCHYYNYYECGRQDFGIRYNHVHDKNHNSYNKFFSTALQSNMDKILIAEISKDQDDQINNNDNKIRIFRDDPLLFMDENNENDINDVTRSEKLKMLKSNIPDVMVVDTMPSFLSYPTKHSYYLLRHGQSIANVDEIISSNRQELAYTNKHSVTELGYIQGYNISSIQLLNSIEQNIKLSNNHNIQHMIRFVSSPFARARQTAIACINGLYHNQTNYERLQQLNAFIYQPPINVNNNTLCFIPYIQYKNQLIERLFGKLDNEAIYTYSYIWPLDQFNSTHTAFNVESVAAVCTRIQQLIYELENEEIEVTISNTNNTIQQHIVLVSHADVLQIAQLYAAHHPNVGLFSSYRFQSKFFVRLSQNLVYYYFTLLVDTFSSYF